VVISQGDVWWADLGEPLGSGPGHRRPVVIIQSDAFNRSRIATVVCIPLTTNIRWSNVPGNVLLPSRVTNLPQDSVANASRVVSIDKQLLIEHVSKLTRAKLELVLAGLDAVLGR
jgi:mRNA interferase MazF